MTTIAAHDLGEHVEWAGFLSGEPAFALADGRIVLPGAGRTFKAHDGLLAAAPSRDGTALLTGGEDGRVCRTTREGTETLAERPGKWIDVVAAGPAGKGGEAFAFAAGRTVWLASDGAVREIVHARAVEGLSFLPRGVRLACARYGGVSLHFAAEGGRPVELEWAGAHTGVTVSPDGRYVVTSMAENALHGWRLDARRAEDSHMRMSGYPAKPKSLSWSAKGRFLASSGANAAICWPFSGKSGPAGKAPLELATRGDAMVVAVACHPVADMVAIGFSDGMVMAARFADAAEHVLRRPGGVPLTALSWDAAGERLAFGCENGEAGIVKVGGRAHG